MLTSGGYTWVVHQAGSPYGCLVTSGASVYLVEASEGYLHPKFSLLFHPKFSMRLPIVG